MEKIVGGFLSTRWFYIFNTWRPRLFDNPLFFRKVAFITSRLDYCNSRLYGLPASHLNTVQRMILNATDSQVSVQSATLFSRNAFNALTLLASDKTTSTF